MLTRPAHASARASFLVASALLGGCAYQADSFRSTHPFRGVYVTVACLDLAINRQASVHGKQVVSYEFGNRCDEPAVVDLATLRVFGRNKDGTAVRLIAFDPRRELRPKLLDARASGREVIAYSSAVAVRSVCIDAGSITHSMDSRLVCFNEGAR